MFLFIDNRGLSIKGLLSIKVTFIDKGQSVYKSVSFRGPQFGPHKTATFLKNKKKKK